MMKNYKGLLYGAVAYSVVIGAIYVTLSLLGLLARWCVFDVPNSSPFIYMLYMLYFRVRGCESTLNLENLGIISSVPVLMNEESDVVQRTTIIFIIYLALHAALVLFSLYALCGVNNSCLGRKSFGIYFMPWILVWIAIILLDIIATTIFALDAVNAQTNEGLMDLLGIQNPQVVGPVFDQLSFMVQNFPPIMMALVAAKFFLILLANIVWVVAITKAGWAAATYHKYVDNSRRNYENNMGTQNPAFEDFEPKNQNRSYATSEQPSSVHDLPVSPSAPRDSAETRYNDTSTRVQTFVYSSNKQQNNQGQTYVDEEIKYRIQRPNVAATNLERPISVTVQQYLTTTYQSESIDPEIENRLSRFQESNGAVIKTVEPLKYDDIPDQQKSIIGVRVFPPTQVNRSQSEIKSKPAPPPKPNNRYSMQPMAEMDEPILYRPQDRPLNGAKVERSSSSSKPVPAELRNQFAFNYLDPNNQVPKRTFQNLSEDEEPPNVPVPDYTLHFPQNSRKRTNLNSSDEDYSGQWSQQNQQRY